MINYLGDVLIIFLLFTLFGIIHSILASIPFKRKLAKKIGKKIAFFRLFYNLLSLVSFYVIYQLSPKPELVIYDLPNPYDLIILIPQFLGIAGFVWSLKFFDTKEFLGINQVFRYFNNKYQPEDLDEKLTLRIGGPYKFTRHPVYFFSIMIIVFRPLMDLFYLTVVVCLIIYFYTGSYYEERKLIAQFGDEYRRYQEQVPRIIPVKLFSPFKAPGEKSTSA